MKFVIKNDAYYIIAKKKIFLFVYLSCLLLVSLFLKSQVDDGSFVRAILGIWIEKDSNVIMRIFLVYSFFVYVYLGYDLFLKDLKFSYGSIFSRLSKKDWVIGKFISICLITCVVKFITYLLTLIIFGINCGLYSYILNLLFTFFWQLIFLICYIIYFKSSKARFLIISVGLLLILIFSFLPQLLMSDFYNILVLVSLNILMVGAYFVIFNKNINFIVERSLV